MNEQLYKFLKGPIFPVVVGVVSFGAGTGLGYILGRRDKKNKIEIHKVPEQMKFDLDLSRVSMEEGINTEQALIEEDLIERGGDIATPAETFILEHLPDTVVLEAEPEEVSRHLVFAPDTEEWNYEEEVKNRTMTAPYVLHKDEFYAEEMEYAQSTLTYYAGDDIMVDQEDTPVYNYAAVVGPLLFGHGSEDPNVFHVRNDQRKAEYEVLYDPGLYGVEVLGLDFEQTQRISNIGPPKMRPE